MLSRLLLAEFGEKKTYAYLLLTLWMQRPYELEECNGGLGLGLPIDAQPELEGPLVTWKAAHALPNDKLIYQMVVGGAKGKRRHTNGRISYLLTVLQWREAACSLCHRRMTALPSPTTQESSCGCRQRPMYVTACSVTVRCSHWATTENVLDVRVYGH